MEVTVLSLVQQLECIYVFLATGFIPRTQLCSDTVDERRTRLFQQCMLCFVCHSSLV